MSEHEITIGATVYNSKEPRDDNPNLPAFGTVAEVNEKTIGVVNVNGQPNEEPIIWNKSDVVTEEEYT